MKNRRVDYELSHSSQSSVEDEDGPFIKIPEYLLNGDSIGGETRKDILTMKYKMEMFKIRNQFYEIENL